jgi:hypothetical protein
MNLMNRITLACLLLAASSAVHAGEVVAEFKGSGNQVTATFEVEAPWILDWRVSTDGDRDSAVDVSLETAPMGEHQGTVLQTRFPGNGVRLFSEGGRFQFRVNALFAGWTLKVEQLTEQEAETYTPRNKSPLD